MKPNIQVNKLYRVNITYQYAGNDFFVNDIFWDKAKAKELAQSLKDNKYLDNVKVWEYKINKNGTFDRFRKVLHTIADNGTYRVLIDR